MNKTIVVVLQLVLSLLASTILAADGSGNIAGYGNTVWGMTEEEVLKAEPRAKKVDKPTTNEASDIVSITIDRIEIELTEFQVWFKFDSKHRKLKQVILQSVNDLSPAATFATVEKLLTQKYGAPTYKQAGKNVSWKLSKTLIELMRLLSPSVFVTYQPAGASADASKNL